MPDDSAPSSPSLPYEGRTIALVGPMGAGKSTVGRRLAEKLGREFYDSDTEIEKAAGLSISEIFSRHGEADFRRGEKQVLRRLLELPPHVLATGGGAYIDAETRALMKEKAVTVWLSADLETLWRRVKAGTFPKPVKLSERVTAWRVEDVRQWLDAQTAR